jgi:hypothetical protein
MCREAGARRLGTRPAREAAGIIDKIALKARTVAGAQKSWAQRKSAALAKVWKPLASSVERVMLRCNNMAWIRAEFATNGWLRHRLLPSATLNLSYYCNCKI